MSKAVDKQKWQDFVTYWTGRGYEKGESQKYWLQLLRYLGVDTPEEYISFEDQVHLDHTSFIDGYIPTTHVLIEQKSLGKSLDAPIKQSDGSLLTPIQQAKRYASELPYSQRPRWIVTSNFAEIYVYDMEHPSGDAEIIRLQDLPKEHYRLQFLVDSKNDRLEREKEISLAAGELVGAIHDRFLEQYNDPLAVKTQHSLNKLCVRLVFLLYAEDADLLPSKTAFRDFIAARSAADLRAALIQLFQALDTPEDERADLYLPDDIEAFPYVNGGLFTDMSIVIPKLTDDIRQLLIKSSDFDWSEISPTIFGAVFESTLNPVTRRAGGMHYTSIENIHKVIDPLFLDALRGEYEAICAIAVPKTKEKKLRELQGKMAGLKFLDPACGSGNFLTEAYLSIRRLENDILREIYRGQVQFGFDEASPIQVSIGQFYGIEINDFAVSVAQAALWIAEHQMLRETAGIVHSVPEFLPLATQAHIVEGNALQLRWERIVSPSDLSYIMGNPPFVGQAMRTKEQANDIQAVFAPSKAGGKLDYVAGWFKKAANYTINTSIQVAFVASNSICQGESVNLLWEDLLNNGIVINFAHTTFLWTSEAKDKASVMCVIVGFSHANRSDKKLFTDSQLKKVDHINGYLKPAPDVFIKNRSKSINRGLAKVVQGSPPADDGRLLLTAEEKSVLLKKYPELSEVVKPFVGSREFINDVKFSRYCFWFVGVNPGDFVHIPELVERFNYVKAYRLKSPVDRIQKTADKPYLFTQNRQPLTNYLFIPRVSSERRRYIPIGFLSPDVIASDSAVLVYNASLYDFGIICSNVHNSWMRTIAGRLKNDYRYAPSVYYNFPFPEPTSAQRAQIEITAQAILDARALYPNHSLADMYGDSMYLFPELLTAHQRNDKAVMAAYGIKPGDEAYRSEAACVAMLMQMYKDLTSA